jgi:eukaryotic-like serine/threonine-protein kinase
MTDTLQYAPNVPLDATLISSPSRHEVAVSAPQAVNALALAQRTTVLPRVEWTGAQPQVVPFERERFEEVGSLGQGGMGEVALLKDHDIERMVARKRLPESPGLDQVLRFVEEIRTVGQLDHPNIVPVHDVGIDASGRYYFLMKHLQGETLETIIHNLRQGDAAAHARFTFPMRLQIFLGVLNALAYAHRKGFIHRDLKPANIMVGPFGEVTVLDWGLARRVQAPAPHAPAPLPLPGAMSLREAASLHTQVGAVIGTPLYMSPEQARGQHDALDARSDLYSANVLFHEFLFLQHYLADRETLAEVLEGVQTASPSLHSDLREAHQRPVPSEYAWAVKRGFAKDPAKRYQSAEEMMEELRAIMDGRIRVHCSRTFVKSGLHGVLRQVEAHPQLLMSAGGLALVAVFASLIHLLLSVLS